MIRWLGESGDGEWGMAGAEVSAGQEGVQGLKNDRRVRMQVNEQAGRKWQESVWS